MGAPETREEDRTCELPSRVAPAWAQLHHLIDGMRARGHGQEAADYLAACLGLAWAKGYTAGLEEGRRQNEKR